MFVLAPVSMFYCGFMSLIFVRTVCLFLVILGAVDSSVCGASG